MATRRKRKKKCKLGFRRDGSCRTTRCPVKLTKTRLCPKYATNAGTKRRRSTGGRRKGKRKSGGGVSKLVRSLRQQGAYVLGYTTRRPSGLIGGGADDAPGNVRNIARAHDQYRSDNGPGSWRGYY